MRDRNADWTGVHAPRSDGWHGDAHDAGRGCNPGLDGQREAPPAMTGGHGTVSDVRFSTRRTEDLASNSQPSSRVADARFSRPRMPMSERAKIFVPFNPLKGFSEALRAKEREVEAAALDDRGGNDLEAPDEATTLEDYLTAEDLADGTDASTGGSGPSNSRMEPFHG